MDMERVVGWAGRDRETKEDSINGSCCNSNRP